jgi:hypothetical protein
MRAVDGLKGLGTTMLHEVRCLPQSWPSVGREKNTKPQGFCNIVCLALRPELQLAKPQWLFQQKRYLLILSSLIRATMIVLPLKLDHELMYGNVV